MRSCPDYSWGYNHCPGPDRERGEGDDSRCWKCSQLRELETLRAALHIAYDWMGRAPGGAWDVAHLISAMHKVEVALKGEKGGTDGKV